MPSYPTRLVIEGVPRIGKWPNQSTSAPEDHTFAGCLRSWLEFVRDDIYEHWLAQHGSDWHSVHEYIVGTSGWAFQLLWTPGRWECTSWDLLAIAPDPLEPIRRAFRAAGYAQETLLRNDYGRSLGCDGVAGEVLRQRIVASIGQGRPVIAIGPLSLTHEACLITGYDEGGEVLLGWHVLHNDEEIVQAGVAAHPSGYFRKGDWLQDTRGIVLIGERQSRPPLREIYREALAWGLQLMRTPAVRGNASGQAAYQAWIEDLQHAEEWTGLDVATLRHRLWAHNCTWGHVAEGRAWGAPFLLQAAAVDPAWEMELQAAATCFDAEHKLFYAAGQEDADAPRFESQEARFADPRTRRREAGLLAMSLERYTEAAQHIERALSI